jgi:dolichol-phosphate mannosyltransferase
MTESKAQEFTTEELQGPVLVLGASGFVGANLFRSLLQKRSDVYGTTSRPSAWRLEGLPEANVVVTDLLVDQNLNQLMDNVKPKTVFDCVAYGAYPFEEDQHLIYQTNLNFAARLIEKLIEKGVARYIHAGSSSEYGDLSAGPGEDACLKPNSPYAVSKAAASELIYYSGKKRGFPCANLRLYSVYGPYEDASRLVPNLVAQGLKGGYPPLANPETSRDFIYVDDVSRAFVSAALHLKPENYGESFNIGSGLKTTLKDMAAKSREIFEINTPPAFSTMPGRKWDMPDWYSNPEKAKKILNWSCQTGLSEGLEKTAAWFKKLPDILQYQRASKRFGLDPVYSVTAVVACYEDAPSIPKIYSRLKAVFEKLHVQHEIIFVNDNSHDNSEEVIRAISARDRNVLGLTNSRNFGSQPAFRRGMEIASKNSCVLLRGDLQDPPEIIEDFVARWKEGVEVVYGVKARSTSPFYLRLAHTLFYKVFDKFSYLSIPHDAGDFSLMDKRVVRSLLQFPERDLFIIGIRAFAGFKQAGVPYIQGASAKTDSGNSLLKNLSRAKKGILSFSNTPLDMLTFFGLLLSGLSCLLAIGQIAVKILVPGRTPSGITTTLIAIIFFGSINLLAVSVLGEYIAKVIEEVKRRPHSILRHVIKDGEIRAASEELSDDNLRRMV